MAMTIPPQLRRPDAVRRVPSPRVTRLGERPTPAAVQRFWTEVEAEGTPLLDDIRDGECTYTFVHRGDDAVRRAGLVTNKIIDPVDYEQALMHRVPGTDIWWLALRLRASWRGSYSIAADRGAPPSLSPTMLAEQERRRTRSLSIAAAKDHVALNAWFDLLRHALPDPYCRRTAPLTGGSVAAGPHAPTADPLPPASAGRLLPVDPALTAGHRMWWHVPDGPAPEHWNTLVLLDGQRWTAHTTTLSAWSQGGVVPPSATLLVGSGDMTARIAALTCSPDFVDTVLRVLTAAPAELGAPLSPLPQDTRIAGQSLGGLTALYAQCVAPERFGVSICQSGSFWWPNAAGGTDPEWLTAAIRDTGIRLGHVYLEAGSAEWPLLGPVRRLREVLAGQAREVRYSEFDGGHDAACWAVSLPKALRGSRPRR